MDQKQIWNMKYIRFSTQLIVFLLTLVAFALIRLHEKCVRKSANNLRISLGSAILQKIGRNSIEYVSFNFDLHLPF